jgi:hypothetical protein
MPVHDAQLAHIGHVIFLDELRDGIFSGQTIAQLSEAARAEGNVATRLRGDRAYARLSGGNSAANGEDFRADGDTPPLAVSAPSRN